jgi:hypothetical protein
MNFNIYKCRAQNSDFISIASNELISDSLKGNSIEKSDLQKYLQRNDPEDYNVFYAELYEPKIHIEKYFESISYKDTIGVDISVFNDKLDSVSFNNATFMNAKLDAKYSNKLYLVKKMHINGISKGIIDFSKFVSLEYVNILKWNEKIRLINKNLSLESLIIWRYNPKNKSLKDLFGELDSIEYLEFNLTNIENLEGIEQLINLKKIVINYGRNLKKVSNLNFCKKLEYIRFNNCKKMEDFDLVEKREGLKIDNVRLPG